MTRSAEHPFTLSFLRANGARRQRSAPANAGETYTVSLLRETGHATPSMTVTLPMYRGAPSNFGVKLSRPGFGPAAELPPSSPA